MYKKQKTISSSKEELANYIDGIDVYNSTLLRYISDPAVQTSKYEISVYEFRPDLIAKEFYGSTNYTGLLLIQCALPLTGYKKGTVLNLIPKPTLDRILDII